MCVISIKVPIRKMSGNLFNDPRIYIEECIFKQQVILQASFVKDDGTLFIFCNFVLSLLVIFLLSGSMW